MRRLSLVLALALTLLLLAGADWSSSRALAQAPKAAYVSIEQGDALAVAGEAAQTASVAIQDEKNGDGRDILLLSLLTVGAAGGAAAFGLVGYLIRKRVGFWLHRPPPGGGPVGGPEHH